ncbi:MAG TPA: SDR family NAD(P)-dependent oxidoreductase, partial [Kofleriaceae bacterium]|nr:SDR family NAD(P)-dependent oxidoreductase [Kofleriaceae bacterium]
TGSPRLARRCRSSAATARASATSHTWASQRAFAAIAKAGHKAAILVNNAGVATGARLAQTDDALWAETIGASLSGAFHCARAAASLVMRAKDRGRIVNITSVVGEMGNGGQVAYAASKAA